MLNVSLSVAAMFLSARVHIERLRTQIAHAYSFRSALWMPESGQEITQGFKFVRKMGGQLATAINASYTEALAALNSTEARRKPLLDELASANISLAGVFRGTKPLTSKFGAADFPTQVKVLLPVPAKAGKMRMSLEFQVKIEKGDQTKGRGLVIECPPDNGFAKIGDTVLYEFHPKLKVQDAELYPVLTKRLKVRNRKDDLIKETAESLRLAMTLGQIVPR